MPRRAFFARSPLLVLACGLWAVAPHPQEKELAPLATPAPAIALRPEHAPGLADYVCATCHAAVAEEWAASAHGLAWVDEVYQEALRDKKQPELCTGCHVPKPLFGTLAQGGASAAPAERPDARADLRHLGVSCESCHLDGSGAMLGPRGTSVAAHASRASEHLRGPGSSALCSACHATTIGPVIGVAKDFAAAGKAERGLSCVGCHMAPIERAWAAGATPHVGRSHALQTPRDPAFLRRALRVRWTTREGRECVVLENRAGHRVPGLVGRSLVFQAELLGADGALLERQALTIDERATLAVDGRRELAFTRSGPRVRLVGRHTEPRAAAPVTFLDEELARE